MSTNGKKHTESLDSVSSQWFLESEDESSTKFCILQAALDLLNEKGGKNVVMAEIAKRAGVSRQALYLHFASRADLFVALARYADLKRGLAKELTRIWYAPTAIDGLSEAVALQARMNPKIWAIARAMDAIRRNDADAERAWQDRLTVRHEGARRIVLRLKEESSLRPGVDVETAIDLLWNLTSLHTWEDLVIERGWKPERYTKHVTELLLRTITKHFDH